MAAVGAVKQHFNSFTFFLKQLGKIRGSQAITHRSSVGAGFQLINIVLVMLLYFFGFAPVVIVVVVMITYTVTLPSSISRLLLSLS